MREINNNQSSGNFPKVELKTPQPAGVPKVDEGTQGSVPVTENLSLTPGAVIGRSQVSYTGNIEADMKTMLENPDAVKKATVFFDEAYKQLEANGSKNPYEKAAVLTHAFKDEFSN